ncbi:hypothetical protein AAG747_05275 [Rapidithrix thailandica]|uniref:Uncharacterized protein n=1 Tax=Rapidithrix thailandica TaxID=413964 RepID=A0AAW9S7K8_9BACT
MDSLKVLFRLGFEASAAGGYFHSVRLLEQFANFPHMALKAKVAVELKALGKERSLVAHRIEEVHTYFKQIGVVMMEQPEYAESYLPWAGMVREELSQKHAQESPEALTLLTAQYTGEIASNLQQIAIILSISTAVLPVPAFAGQWKHVAQKLSSITQKISQLTDKLLEEKRLKVIVGMSEEVFQKAFDICQANVEFDQSEYLLTLSKQSKDYYEEIRREVESLLQTDWGR